MRITFISFSTTSASALYPFQMLSALIESGNCELQVLVAKRAYNIDAYRQLCNCNNIALHEFETYEHNSKAVLLSFLKIGRFRSIINTVKEFNPDVIYFPFGCVWAPLLYPFLNHIAPVIDTLHDPHPHDKSTRFVESIFRYSGGWAIRRIRGLVVLNMKDAEYVSNKFHLPVTVIPHAAFSFYNKLSKGIDVTTVKRQICFIGRIEPYKGVDLLVDAFNQVKNKDIKLIIAGGGTISEETHKKISLNTHITLVNRFISDEEMVDIIENSDFMVLPYLRASQSGVIPMSFALGRTVVATKVGALEEQVKDGTGILVEPCATQIANAIDKMYANTFAMVERSKRAKLYADEELTWSHSVKLLLEFMRKVK